MHIIGASIAVTFDLIYPFSQGKNVANYIHANQLEDKIIVGWRDDFMPSIIAYGNLKQIYYPQGKRFGSFVIFDSKRQKPITLEEIVEPVITLGKKPEDFLFIFTPEIFNFDFILPDVHHISQIERSSFDINSSTYRFKKLIVFAPSIVLGENFALYKLEKEK